MQCRTCGTEIAARAIVCYRCGVGTADPVRTPAPITPRGGRPSLAAGVVLLLLALAALALADISGYPQAMGVAAVVLATIGALLLIVRLARRR